MYTLKADEFYFEGVEDKDEFLAAIFDAIYAVAKEHGVFAGGSLELVEEPEDDLVEDEELDYGQKPDWWFFGGLEREDDDGQEPPL